MQFLKCALLLLWNGIALFVLGRLLPKRWFNYRAIPYRSWKVEDHGKIYTKIKIQKWQSLLPDMSRIFPALMPAKKIDHRPSDAELNRMLRETCIAEFIHLMLCITSLEGLDILPGALGAAVYAVYVLLGNLPFILIQRWNRPRLAAMLESSRRRVERQRSKCAENEKRVLLLSCNTGEGHNSCAKAIKEAFDARNMQCDLVDALEFVSPWFAKWISRGHTYIYRHHPLLFRFGYRFSEKHPELFKEKSFVHGLLSLSCDPLASYIWDHVYDIVIFQHVFSAPMLTTAMQRNGLKLRTGFVATDYTRSPSMERSNLDWYFVPDESLARDFCVPPVTPEKIVASGIPVRRQIYARMDRNQAKRHYGIPENARHLLVICGSMGCGPLKWLIALLKNDLKPDQYITVVCGTNQKLKAYLDRHHSSDPRIRIYGYRNDISLLMDSADLYMTKPGGLSVTEAAVKNLPMVMINAVAGCEEYNKNFFVKNGLGVTADSIWSLSRLCMDILSDENSLEQMRAAGKRLQRGNASQTICDCLLEGSANAEEAEKSAEFCPLKE